MLELAGRDAALLPPAREVAEVYAYLQRLQREKQRVLGQAQAVAVESAPLTVAEAEERAAIAAAQRLLTLEAYERKARSRLRKTMACL